MLERIDRDIQVDPDRPHFHVPLRSQVSLVEENLMIRPIAIVLVTALVPASRQDERRPDSPADDVRAALERSVAGVGIQMSANVSRPDALGQFMDVGLLGDIKGAFSVRIGADGTRRIGVESPEGRFEVYARKDRLVTRSTWIGAATPEGAFFPLDTARLSDPSALMRSLRFRPNDWRRQESDDGRASVITGFLAPELLAEELDEEEMRQVRMLMRTRHDRSIEAEFVIGKESGQVERYRVKVVRTFEGMADAGGEDGPADAGKVKVTYSFVIDKRDPDLKVDLPEDVRKLLAE